MAPTLSRTLPQRSTLTSLPPELLLRVVLLLDRPSALSFARTARCCTSVADYGIWRDLDLGNSTGADPPYRSFRMGSTDSDVRTGEPAQTAAVRKIDLVTARLAEDERRWRMIRSIRMATDPDLEGKHYQLLECTALALESLELCATFRPPRPVKVSETIVPRLTTGPRLSFPLLRHLKIDDQAKGLVPFICSLAPQLETLSVSFWSGTLERKGRRIFPPPAEHSHVSSLSFSPSDLTYTGLPSVLADPLASHLAYLPNLRRLSIDHLLVKSYRTSLDATEMYIRQEDYEETLDRLAKAFARLTQLRELSWPDLSLEQYTDLIGYTPDRLSHLTRLHLGHTSWDKMIRYIPRSPNLESIFLSARWCSSKKRCTPDFGDAPCGAQAMLPAFADRLRSSSRLHNIHWLPNLFDEEEYSLEELDAITEVNGNIISYRHGDDPVELLHARFWSDLVETSDVSLPPVARPPSSKADGHDSDEEPNDNSDEEAEDNWEGADYEPDRSYDTADPTQTVVRYRLDDGTRREKTYKHLAEPVLQHWTDYNGVVIPLEVIEEMRRQEGASEEDSERRGVQVSDKGWDVLMEYYQANKGKR